MSGNIENTENSNFIRIYQFADGSFLPDTSQPNMDEDYEIRSSQYTPHKSTRYINIEIGKNGKAKRMGSDKNLVEDENDLPDLYEKRENCCGCTACYAVCSEQAISMRPDEEGFLYPIVDAKKCIRCYICLSVCAFKENQREKGYIE